jgi:hypothetical protein
LAGKQAIDDGSALMSDDRIPIIVGACKVTDYPADPVHGLEPLALMVVTLERASEDAGGGLLMAIDPLDRTPTLQ